MQKIDIERFKIAITEKANEQVTLQIKTSEELTDNDIYCVFVTAFFELRKRDPQILNNLLFASLAALHDDELIMNGVYEALAKI